jgi:hypothetical protein
MTQKAGLAKLTTLEFLTSKYGHVLLTASEVADTLRITTKTWQNGVSAGRYPDLKPTGTHLYHAANVADFVDSLQLSD